MEGNLRFALQSSDIGFGIKDDSIFKLCKFYDKTEDVKKIMPYNKKEFTMLESDNIIEITLRLYLKDHVKTLDKKQCNQLAAIKHSIEEKLKEKMEKCNMDRRGLIAGQNGTSNRKPQEGQMSPEEASSLKDSLDKKVNSRVGNE